MLPGRSSCCTLEKMLLSLGGVKWTIIWFLAVYCASLAFLLRRLGFISRIGPQVRPPASRAVRSTPARVARPARVAGRA